MNTFYLIDILTGNKIDTGVRIVRLNTDNGYFEFTETDNGVEIRGMGRGCGGLVIRPVVTNVIKVNLK